MTDIEMMMTFMGLGFAALGTLILYLHSITAKSIRQLTEELRALREEVRDIDRRLCRLEGAFSNKDCCMLRHDHKEKAQ